MHVFYPKIVSLIDDRGIVDLTGLEFAANLEELYLGGRNRITDLSSLANLTNLTHLHLWHRRVEGMPPYKSGYKSTIRTDPLRGPRP